MEALLPLGILAIIGAAVWFGWQQQQKRRALLQGFAASQGWTWTLRDDSWTAHFQGDPFGEGDHRKAQNVLQGTYRGRQMVAFDYSYQTHSSNGQGGQSTQTHRYAVCALGLPAWLPRFQLTPEGLLGRVGTLLGMQDVELESEDFNRRYRVRCEDPKLAYDVLQPRTMELLLRRPALHLRLAGADALCWETGSHSPVQLLARLDTLAAVVDGIPSYVWNDRKGPA